jgi:hypothetical protein
VSDQRPYHYAARNRGFERPLELGAVEAKNEDVDLGLGVTDGLQQRRQAVVRLDD